MWACLSRSFIYNRSHSYYVTDSFLKFPIYFEVSKRNLLVKRVEYEDTRSFAKVSFTGEWNEENNSQSVNSIYS